MKARHGRRGATTAVGGGEYLPGMNVEQYLASMQRNHRHVWERLDLRDERVSAASRWLNTPTEFDDEGLGRGAAYRRAQTEGTARREGITTLLRYLGVGLGGKNTMTLDVLGGDGLIARNWLVSSNIANHTRIPVITGDLSGQMVHAALGAGLPAVRQPAQHLFLKDCCLDGVVIAYGTHHIPRSERPMACLEALRVLHSGGRLVLHDYEEGSPVAQWFEEVVHKYSLAGHPYEHFTATEMTGYLRQCGFVDVGVERVYDPFRIWRTDERLAITDLLRYVFDMYGLCLLSDECKNEAETMARLQELLERCFRYDSSDRPFSTVWPRCLDLRRDGDGFVAELPRIALVATGSKL